MADRNIKELMTHYPHTGTLEWIGVRPAKRADLQVLDQVNVDKKTGLEGDHYSGLSRKRQVTLIQAEDLRAVAVFLRQEEIDPRLVRRNLVVSGLNLNALKDRTIRIGDTVAIKITGECHPCSRMEENLGPGGYNAMRGHGGLTARVEEGGLIRRGDPILVL